MSRQLTEVLQQLAINTVNAGAPSDSCIAVVASPNPLVIRIDQKKTIKSEILVLTDLVRYYSVDVTVSHTTENKAGGAGDAEFASHNHDYKGRKKITVHNALNAGESVLLIRQAGGQEYIVLSRIYDHTNLSGQWV